MINSTASCELFTLFKLLEGEFEKEWAQVNSTWERGCSNWLLTVLLTQPLSFKRQKIA